MLKGIIINNISNMFEVKVKDKIYSCTARKKIKQTDLSPVVGDYVEIEELDNKNTGVICNIMPRSMYSKRPKMSNLTQMIFVVSLNLPKPDLLLLDKQLVYANLNNINAVICINKIDLGNKEELDKICSTYRNIGYKVIETNAKKKEGIEELRKILKNNITAFSGNSGVRKININ